MRTSERPRGVKGDTAAIADGVVGDERTEIARAGAVAEVEPVRAFDGEDTAEGDTGAGEVVTVPPSSADEIDEITIAAMNEETNSRGRVVDWDGGSVG